MGGYTGPSTRFEFDPVWCEDWEVDFFNRCRNYEGTWKGRYTNPPQGSGIGARDVTRDG